MSADQPSGTVADHHHTVAITLPRTSANQALQPIRVLMQHLPGSPPQAIALARARLWEFAGVAMKYWHCEVVHTAEVSDVVWAPVDMPADTDADADGNELEHLRSNA